MTDELPSLTSCDLEPIHLPGCIQPHGVLFEVSADDLQITAVSANAGLYFDSDAASLLNMPLSHVLDASSLGAVAAAISARSDIPYRLSCLPLLSRARFAWRGSMRSGADGILLEAELLRPDEDVAAETLFDSLETASRGLIVSTDTIEIDNRLVEAVRQLTGYSRVLLYRFAPDWSGEVIAEASDGQMPAYLGLHFPASDIPVQARALYARTAERQIPDVHYEPVPLLQTGQGAIDLGDTALRSVSPVHLAYLRNMAAGASFSISVLHNGKLWGLIACHHPSARRVSLELRRSCVLLARIGMSRRGGVEDVQVLRPNPAVRAFEQRLLAEAAIGEDGRDTQYADLLVRNSSALLDLLDATGLVLTWNGTTTLLGRTPKEADLANVLGWLGSRVSEPSMPDLLATDHFAEMYPASRGLDDAAGILALPFGAGAGDFIFWLRPEIVRVINWAGDPAKPAGRFSLADIPVPRQSFASWTVETRGRSRPWTTAEIAAASSLRNTLLALVALRSTDLQRVNAQLRHSNKELESFAYIASHDLKEPLRQIEIFASLLQRANGRGAAPEKIERWFSGITKSSRRLREFIDRLAAYARLGSGAQAFAPVDLNGILSAVLQDFAGQIAEANGTVNAERLPVVTCDGLQIRQVLQNLVGNAVKYRHAGRPLVIAISVEQQQPPAADGRYPSLPILALRIEDNGIGFEARHAEQIFKPFERLHSTEAYGGSGLGLAICRQVLDRHGGRITAAGRPGEGAVFTVFLPMRPQPTQGT